MSARYLSILLMLVMRVPVALANQATSVETQSLPYFETTLATTELRLGRPFEMCVVARHRKNTRVIWPAAFELGEGLEEGARRQTTEDLGADLLRSELCAQLTPFDTAIEWVPAIAIGYDLGTGEPLVRESAAVAVHVVQQITGEDATLRAPAEPVDVQVRAWRVIALLGALVVLCGLAIAALLWRRRHAPDVGTPRADQGLAGLSPHQEALAQLTALESSGALDADQLKPSYLEMSEIFRSYLGRRFGFSALDLTTAEIRSRLTSAAGDQEWIEEVVSWLSRCDLVKYANSVADADEAREALYAARVLIDRTKELEHDRPREVTRA